MSSDPATVSEYGSYIDLQNYLGTQPERSGSIYLSGSDASEKMYTNVEMSIPGLLLTGSDGGAGGSVEVNIILDEDNMASDSNEALATQQSIKAYVDAQVTAQDLDFQGDTGGALNIDLDSETLTIAGGKGLSTTGSSNTLTVNVDMVQLTAVATVDDADLIMIDDGATGTIRKMTRAAFIESAALDSINIDGGSIDGTTIGDASAAAGTFTTLVASTSLSASYLRVSDTKASEFGGALNVKGALGVSGSATMNALQATAGTFTTSLSASYLRVGAGSAGHSEFGSDLNVKGEFNVSGSTALADTLTVAGLAQFSGNVDLGNATSDTITCTARFDSDLVPSTDGARDLGSSALEFKDLYLDGVAYLDAINSDAALAWTLVDNNSDALSFDAAGKSGIMFVDTSNGAEHVGFGGYVQIEGSDASSNGLTLGTNGGGVGLLLYGASANEKVQYSAANHTLVWTDSGAATHITIGGDANGEYAIDVADGSNAKNKIRAAAFVTYSDERLKTDVDEIQNATATVNSIKAVNFTWKKDGTRDFGFLAQDLARVVPQAVHGHEEGLFGVDYGRLTSILVKAIQEQNAEIVALKEKLDI